MEQMMWVAQRVFENGKLEMPVEIDGKRFYGFMPVFETREEAQRICPGIPLVQVYYKAQAWVRGKM